MAVVILKKLPGCDVCKALDLPHIQPATADSPLKMAERTIWGYSCDYHKFLRTGPITYLFEEEP